MDKETKGGVVIFDGVVVDCDRSEGRVLRRLVEHTVVPRR